MTFSSGCGPASGSGRRALGRPAGDAPGTIGELVQARVGATATGDERDVQLAVEILAAQKRRRPGDDSGSRQGPADKLTARQLTLAYLLRRLLHGSAPRHRLAAGIHL